MKEQRMDLHDDIRGRSPGHPVLNPYRHGLT